MEFRSSLISQTMALQMSNKSARTAYCCLFVASLFISWILAEFAAPLLDHFPWTNDADHTKESYQINTVLRVSFGNFLFFMMLALTMIGVNDESDWRNSWHLKGWTLKITIWLLSIIIMFFMPNKVVHTYGLLSKYGAGLFLLLQLCLLLDFTSKLHDELERHKLLYAASAGCFIAALAFYTLLFYWFAPLGQDCLYNVLLIVVTLTLALILAVIMMMNEGLFPAMVIFFYSAYVCYTGLSSEPQDDVCNGLHNKPKVVSLSSIILGITSTTLSLLYVARRAGSIKPILSASTSPREVTRTVEVKRKKITFAEMFMFHPHEPEPIPLFSSYLEVFIHRPVSYSYTLFYLIYAMASMYSAMLLSLWTSWSETSDLTNTDWTSTLVKISAGWISTFAYIILLILKEPI